MSHATSYRDSTKGVMERDMRGNENPAQIRVWDGRRREPASICRLDAPHTVKKNIC